MRSTSASPEIRIMLPPFPLCRGLLLMRRLYPPLRSGGGEPCEAWWRGPLTPKQTLVAAGPSTALRAAPSPSSMGTVSPSRHRVRRLVRCIEFRCVAALFARAEARTFPAAEWHVIVDAGRWQVDHHHARLG